MDPPALNHLPCLPTSDRRCSHCTYGRTRRGNRTAGKKGRAFSSSEVHKRFLVAVGHCLCPKAIPIKDLSYMTHRISMTRPFTLGRAAYLRRLACQFAEGFRSETFSHNGGPFFFPCSAELSDFCDFWMRWPMSHVMFFRQSRSPWDEMVGSDGPGLL